MALPLCRQSANHLSTFTPWKYYAWGTDCGEKTWAQLVNPKNMIMANWNSWRGDFLVHPQQANRKPGKQAAGVLSIRT
jgi:hypothetical protein